MVLLLVVMLLITGAGEATAQHTYKFQDSLGTYEVKFKPHDPNTKFVLSPTKPLTARTHELRLSTSWGGTDEWGTIAYYEDLNYFGSEYYNYTHGPSHRHANIGLWLLGERVV